MRIIVATHNEGKLVEIRRILQQDLGAQADEVELVSAGSLGLPDPVETGTTFEENALLKARDVASRTGLPAIADDSGLIVDVLGAAPGILSARWSGVHGDDEANNALLLAQIADIPDAHRTARFRCAAALAVPEGFAADASVSDAAEAGAMAVDDAADSDHANADVAADADDRGTNGVGFGTDTDFSAAGIAEHDRGGERGAVEDGDRNADNDGATPTPYAIAAQYVQTGDMPGCIIRTPCGEQGFGYDPLFVPDDQPGRTNEHGEPLTSAEMTPAEKNTISHRGKAIAALMPSIERLLSNR